MPGVSWNKLLLEQDVHDDQRTTILLLGRNQQAVTARPHLFELYIKTASQRQTSIIPMASLTLYKADFLFQRQYFQSNQCQPELAAILPSPCGRRLNIRLVE